MHKTLIIPVAFTPFTYFKSLGFRSMYTDTVNFQNLNTDDNDKAIRYISKYYFGDFRVVLACYCWVFWKLNKSPVTSLLRVRLLDPPSYTLTVRFIFRLLQAKLTRDNSAFTWYKNYRDRIASLNLAPFYLPFYVCYALIYNAQIKARNQWHWWTFYIYIYICGKDLKKIGIYSILISEEIGVGIDT